MSIVAFPDSSNAVSLPIQATTPGRSNSTSSRADFVRRRGTLEQGRALEALGHAVEYLVDSQLFASRESSARDDQEAVQILMRLSRAVFAECPEVVSLRRRVGRWFVERFAGDPDAVQRG